MTTPFFSRKFSQEAIVFTITVVLFVAFAVTLDGFADLGNLLSILQSIAILCTLGVGMAIAVIGRGVDLSLVAAMAMSVAWMVSLVPRLDP